MPYVTAPRTLKAFPDAYKTKPKGGRARWQDDEYIYEWDRRHGRVEKYDKRGHHLGEFDPHTGERTKGAEPNRTIEP